jgi:hypothetical protein
MTASTFSRADIKNPENSGRSAYFFHPSIDLWFVCGGWLLAVIAINYLYAVTSGAGAEITTVGKEAIPPAMPVLVLIGAYLVSQPHTAATIFKLYGEKSTVKRHKVVGFVIPALLALLLAAALHIPLLARLEATMYVALALHHVMAQCYGIALTYCTRSGMTLRVIERRLLQTTFWTAVFAAVLQQLSSNFPKHTLLGFNLFQADCIPTIVPLALQAAAIISLLYLGVLQLQRSARSEAVMPLPAVTTMLTATALLTVWNTATDMVWLFVPACFHGSQYLVVTMSYFIKNESRKQSDEKIGGLAVKEIAEFIAIRLSELFVVGLILFVGLPLLIAHASGVPFIYCSSLIFLALNFHHFAADGTIWKLRESTVRESLSH